MSVTGGSLTSSGGLLQIPGLASGLNTNAIIQAELAVQEQPIQNMQYEIQGMQTQNTQLTSIQTALQTVLTDVQGLEDPVMFAPSQTISSSNPSLVSAVSSGSGTAPIGSSTLYVTQLAAAAQRTFTFASPSSTDTITIDGASITLAAGSTVSELAQAINSDSGLDVYAATTISGQIVLSDRSTGYQSGSYIQVSDGTGALVEDGALANAGQNATFTLNGVAGSSATDTLANVLAGGTLTLNGVTGTNTPVTITAQPPAASASSIAGSVQQFVSDYNSAIQQIESAINTAPQSETQSSSYNPNDGSLFGDVELESFIGDMRDAMVQPGSGLPTGMAAMSDIGVTTGSSSGSINQSAVNGILTLNTGTLQSAIASNPSGVQAVLQSWATNLSSMLETEAGPGGNLQTRIDGNGTEITDLQNQYAQMQALYAARQTAMQQQWAHVEGVLSQLHSQSSSLTSFASAATTSSSSSSTSSSSSSGG